MPILDFNFILIYIAKEQQLIKFLEKYFDRLFNQAIWELIIDRIGSLPTKKQKNVTV